MSRQKENNILIKNAIEKLVIRPERHTMAQGAIVFATKCAWGKSEHSQKLTIFCTKFRSGEKFNLAISEF